MLTTIAGAGADAGVGTSAGGLVAIVHPFTADPGPDPDTTAAPIPGVPGAGACLLVTGLVFVIGVIETDVAGVAVVVAVDPPAPPIVIDDKLVVDEMGDSHRAGAGESSPPNPLLPFPDMLLLLGVVGGIIPVKEDVSPTEDPDPGLDPLYPPILLVLP